MAISARIRRLLWHRARASEKRPPRLAGKVVLRFDSESDSFLSLPIASFVPWTVRFWGLRLGRANNRRTQGASDSRTAVQRCSQHLRVHCSAGERGGGARRVSSRHRLFHVRCGAAVTAHRFTNLEVMSQQLGFGRELRPFTAPLLLLLLGIPIPRTDPPSIVRCWCCEFCS
jgi:hypothetical protein